MIETIEHLGLGLSVALTLQNVFFCFLGCLIGTLVGVLPGVGPVATISILLPVTLSLDPTGALIMLAGIYYGAQYGGSTTAILVNIPGEATAVVTAIDGHEMAKKGQGGLALGLAAIGSFIAGTFATIVIAALATPMTKLGLLFGPAEYFSLMIMGLVLAVVLAHGSLVKALAMIVAGVLLSCVGADMETGRERMTFGLYMLTDGIEFVVLAMGGSAIGAELGSATVTPTPTTCDGVGLDPAIGTWMPGTLNPSLFQSWATGGTNNGLALVSSLTDSTQWKRFSSVNSSRTPNLAPRAARWPRCRRCARRRGLR